MTNKKEIITLVKSKVNSFSTLGRRAKLMDMYKKTGIFLNVNNNKKIPRNRNF